LRFSTAEETITKILSLSCAAYKLAAVKVVKLTSNPPDYVVFCGGLLQLV
jgi:hypothetical protein